VPEPIDVMSTARYQFLAISLLFLTYINDLPNCLRAAAPRIFADGTNITLSAKTLTELKQALIPKLSNRSCWLKANKLSLNVAKTELMIIG